MKCQTCKKDKPPEGFYWRKIPLVNGSFTTYPLSKNCRKCHNIKRSLYKPEESRRERLLRKDLEKKANALLVGE